MYRYATKDEPDKAFSFASALPAFELCREYNLGRSNILKGKHLSEYLQANIRLFGKALLECLQYFECQSILTDEEKAPFNAEQAKKKIAILKEILE